MMKRDIRLKRLLQLYDGGARSFVLLDVPPMEKSPLGHTGPLPVPLVRSYVVEWNRRLQFLVQRFQRKHMDALITIYSTYDLFERIFSNPRRFPQTRQLSVLGPEFCVDYAVYVSS
jgi:hypothetical protein